MKFTFSLTLLAFFIQYSSALECYFDVEVESERNSTDQIHCVCGSYCASMHLTSEKIYLWTCGCLVDENGKALHMCQEEGTNKFNGSFVDCCSRNLCNDGPIVTKIAQSYNQSFSILILTFTFVWKVFFD